MDHYESIAAEMRKRSPSMDTQELPFFLSQRELYIFAFVYVELLFLLSLNAYGVGARFASTLHTPIAPCMFTECSLCFVKRSNKAVHRTFSTHEVETPTYCGYQIQREVGKNTDNTRILQCSELCQLKQI